MKKTDHKVTLEKIETEISRLDCIDHVEVIDNSHLHSGHREAMKNPEKGHFQLVVRFKENNYTRLKEHRIIYHALAPLMKHIHALSIQIIK